MAENARVTVVCALAAEARCLIEHWRLAALRERPFALYGDVDTRVVIAGVGSHAAAAAVGFAAGLREARDDDIWLNLGIAGHRHFALGTPLLAARVSHHGRDGAWYPSLLFTYSNTLAARCAPANKGFTNGPLYCVSVAANGCLPYSAR